MKMIVILLAVVIIGLLITKQLNPKSTYETSNATQTEVIVPPKVPTNPEDVKQFDKDINQFMKDTENKRREEMDKELGDQ